MKQKINNFNKIGVILLAILMVNIVSSCHDLTELNENPNSVEEPAVPQLLTRVLYSAAVSYHEDAYASRTGTMMQYFVLDAWEGDTRMEFTSEEFDKFLGNKLRDAKELERLSEEQQLYVCKNIAKIMQAFVWGYMTDCFGDIPFSEALSKDIYFPKYDSQKEVYEAVLKMLEEANARLSEIAENDNLTTIEHRVITEYDVIYGGDIKNWQRFANSLQLRYYMRLSLKLNEFAKNGVERIMSDANKYPIFESNADQAKVEYQGTLENDSFKGGKINDPTERSEYRRKKACKTFVDKLIDLNDPRLDVIWDKVAIRIQSDPTDDRDDILDGVRYVGQNLLEEHATDKINGDPLYSEEEYVGIPPHPKDGNIVRNYNFNIKFDEKKEKYGSATSQSEHKNEHVSQLNHDVFREDAHVLNPAYLMQYSEVCFLLAEAALESWNVGGSAEQHYNNGVKAALDRFGVSPGYEAYVAQPEVAWSEAEAESRLAEQRWLSMFMMPESWFAWRKKGLPSMLSRVKTGSDYSAAAIPVTAIRYQYDSDEPILNTAEYNKAVNNPDNLEVTQYNTTTNTDHLTSKMWVLQNTGEGPW